MDYFDSGKPAVGIRTTTHAFWKDRTFAPKYFGGHYKTHYTERIVAQVNPDHADHPMVRGVERKWGQGEGPYVSTPLSDGATPLVFSYGHNREGGKSRDWYDSYDSPNYPVAWAFRSQRCSPTYDYFGQLSSGRPGGWLLSKPFLQFCFLGFRI